MKKPIKIGQQEFKFKKDAITYYRSILNSYDFGQSLNDTDYKALIDLLDYDYLNYLSELDKSNEIESDGNLYLHSENLEDQPEIEIVDIKISKVQFNTKCFEVFYSDNSSHYISYLMLINNKGYDAEKLFYAACRNAIHADVRRVKQEYFDKYSIKGEVKCQETGILSKWTELVVDHRQPNTFSIIVDRFKEVNRIDLNGIEYSSNEQNHIIFKDENLTKEFRNYHKQRAALRIVRKECNSSRTGMARIKKSSKDLTVK